MIGLVLALVVWIVYFRVFWIEFVLGFRDDLFELIRWEFALFRGGSGLLTLYLDTFLTADVCF